MDDQLRGRVEAALKKTNSQYVEVHIEEASSSGIRYRGKDLEEIGICDRIINEPTGGAHREPEQMNQILKKIILEELDLIVDQNDNKDYLQSRIKRYEPMGRFQED